MRRIERFQIAIRSPDGEYTQIIVKMRRITTS
jgi:hypothetical protein